MAHLHGSETWARQQLIIRAQIQNNVQKLEALKRELLTLQAHAAGSGVNYFQNELDTDDAPTKLHALIGYCVNFYTAMHIGDVVGLQRNYNALREIGDQLPAGSFNNGALWQHIETEIDARVQRLDNFSYGTSFAIPQYLIARACIWKEVYLVDTCWLNQCLSNHEEHSLPGMPTSSQSPYIEMEP